MHLISMYHFRIWIRFLGRIHHVASLTAIGPTNKKLKSSSSHEREGRVSFMMTWLEVNGPLLLPEGPGCGHQTQCCCRKARPVHDGHSAPRLPGATCVFLTCRDEGQTVAEVCGRHGDGVTHFTVFSLSSPARWELTRREIVRYVEKENRRRIPGIGLDSIENQGHCSIEDTEYISHHIWGCITCRVIGYRKDCFGG